MIEVPSPPVAFSAGVIAVGRGMSEIIPVIDFETYSEAGFIFDKETQKWGALPGERERGLSAVGTAQYVRHPTAEVLCLAYDLRDGKGVQQWFPGDVNPMNLLWHIIAGGLIEAWNVAFEYQVWMNICAKKYNWPPLYINQLRCAMAKSRAFGLPGGLEAAGNVLNTTIKKDKNGKRLITLFTQPRNPTKNNPALRNFMIGEDGAAFANYNKTDVEAECEISKHIPDLEGAELEFWKTDFKINARGVGVDLEAAKACNEIIDQAYEKYNAELFKITNGVVTAASQLPKMTQWLKSRGVLVSDLTAETVDELLKSAPPLAPDIHRVLQIRQLAGSAAVKKLRKMINQAVPDERYSGIGSLHNLFIYHKARTGRTAGAEVQPQNMPNSGPILYECLNCHRIHKISGRCLFCGKIGAKTVEWNADHIDQVLDIATKTRCLETIEYYYGDAIDAIYGCLRGLFIAAPFHDLICSDFSAIEAVVLSVLAQEEWRLNIFETHGKIYEASASKLSGIPLDKILEHKERTGQHHPLRKLGKVAELAAGYQGGVAAWKRFGADEFLTDDEIQKNVWAWRDANPRIVNLWKTLDQSAKAAINNPGKQYGYYIVENDVLYCILPSGKNMIYHNPRIIMGPYGEQIQFKTWNTNSAHGPVGWISMSTFGGRLAQNIDEGVSRDFLAYAAINLEQAGYPIVLQVHDELAAEVPHGWGSIEEFERIMSTRPAWGANYPIRVGGSWRGRRYRK